MRQLISIAAIQSFIWYVLYFSGTSFYADNVLVGLNVFTLLSAVVIARATIATSDRQFIMGAVREGVIGPNGPIRTALSMAHCMVIVVLMISFNWMFGAVAWILFSAVHTTAYFRAKKLLTPENIKIAKLAIKKTNEYIEQYHREEKEK